MIYLTGDTHGSFERIADFCMRMETTKDDTMIILGDAGVNFSGGWRDMRKKEFLNALPITLLCIHGNHERRPQTIPSYKEHLWRGGMVYVEDAYPSILFAKDGEIYDLDGRRAIAIGGAYSIDKALRIPGQSWWPDEQPSAEVKAQVEKKLDQLGWKVNIVLSHTVPLKYEPVEVFLPGLDQTKVDKTTEEWLGGIEASLNYGAWYAGHYHTSKRIDRMHLMFEDYDMLHQGRLEFRAEAFGGELQLSDETERDNPSGNEVW